MRTSIIVFGVVMICFLSVGNLWAATPKGKVDVDKALEHAGRQYLFMRDELKGTDLFPKTYDTKKQKPENSSSKWWCSECQKSWIRYSNRGIYLFYRQ